MPMVRAFLIPPPLAGEGGRRSRSGGGLLCVPDVTPPPPFGRTLPFQGRDGFGRAMHRFTAAVLTTLLLILAAPTMAQDKKDPPRKFGIGRLATPQEIAGWDIDVRPDGQGLPDGKGMAKDGEEIYMAKCAACHGEFGEGAGRWPVLAGGKGTLKSDDPGKTVGSYFPYLSTLFDYVRHAMPYGDAQSLTNDELYAVVAYVLNLNDIVPDDFVLSKETFGQVKMPNAGGFYDDDRDSTEKAFWNPKPCMSNCKPEAKVVGRARVIDVTPEDAKGRLRAD
jgi:S-disulfanyl-L-cysteine oxidoreductase SoxD